jgi:hypothetical protein
MDFRKELLHTHVWFRYHRQRPRERLALLRSNMKDFFEVRVKSRRRQLVGKLQWFGRGATRPLYTPHKRCQPQLRMARCGVYPSPANSTLVDEHTMCFFSLMLLLQYPLSCSTFIIKMIFGSLP